MYDGQRVQSISKRAPIVVFEAHWLPKCVWFQSDDNDDRYIVHRILVARNTQCRDEEARGAPTACAYGLSGMSLGYTAISMWMKLVGLINVLMSPDFGIPFL